MKVSSDILVLADRVEAELSERFDAIDRIALENTERVLEAFHEERVGAELFSGSTGYGYDDRGRELLESIYARVFGAEAALVRPHFVNGTHAIACALYAALRPGDVLLAATGRPYDTLQSVIGLTGRYPGSLASYGVEYREVGLDAKGQPDLEAICREAADPRVKAVELQRSRGYASRPALSVEKLNEVTEAVHKVNPGAAVILDNCYGEFTAASEPKADLLAGSLIKNPGGGLAPTGGYVVGRRDLVEAAAMRLTVPGIGAECGSWEQGYRLFYQGLMLAPHTVAQAVKTAVFAARMLELSGFRTYPGAWDERNDIIQSVDFGRPELLEAFCQGIQAASPVDSFAVPVAADMPGYEDQVIMAAGAFVQGSSIELSCDGPMRQPYTAFLQGGLTYEMGKIGILRAVEALLKTKN